MKTSINSTVFLCISILHFALLIQQDHHGVIFSLREAHAATIQKPASPIGGLASGLVGWWTMDGKDLVANVADLSGQGNNGFMSGFTSTSSAVIQGKAAQALNFTGSTYVDAGNPSSLAVTTGTMSAWIYVSSAPATDGSTIFTIASKEDVMPTGTATACIFRASTASTIT